MSVSADATTSLSTLFSNTAPAVVAFINKLVAGTRPLFPPIFGTGYFIDDHGLVATNRHVIEFFDQLPSHPITGESCVGALVFLSDDSDGSCQMLALDVMTWDPLSAFTSTAQWYGNDIPDIGFVQLKVRDNPVLPLASEKFYLRTGMPIATIGYPMGTLPFTILKKLNQVGPLIRHGIVSSVFPFPTALPHGFTIDIMQQGGSSGSPILRTSDGAVVGMMASGILNNKLIQVGGLQLLFPQDTNISIAEPSHIIREALTLYRKDHPHAGEELPTLLDLRNAYPKPNETSVLDWDVL